MRRFVKILGGEKGASSYHSIFADPAPESGSKTDIAKNTRQTLSRKKPQAPLHISKLNQPFVAELSSPTTSTISAPKGRESVAELPASSNTQVSELDAWNPAINPGQAAWKEVESQTEQQPKEEPKAKEDEETKEEEKTHTSFLSISIDEEPVDEKPIANHTPILTPKPKPEPKPNLDSDLLIFSDTTDAIPGFGRPFGVAPTSILREQKTKEPEPEPNPDLQQPGSTTTGPKSPEAFFQQVDEELEALYADYLKSSGKQRSSASKAPKKARESISRSNPEPEACIICLEPFSADGVKAPDILSIACQHTPSVCYICLAKSIKHDLDTKFWNEIKCPECKTLFIHNDIERFADEETFTRYNKLSFRHALNADKNFIWCLDCDFGQLHEPGAAQPRVRCLSCSAESCFKHSIGWHDGFTCDEYDAVLWDPDSYKAIKEKNSGTSETNAQSMTEKDMRRTKKKEETRQQKLHEAQKKAARKKQEEEAARVRKEKKAKAEAAQVQQENIEEQETSQEGVKDDFKEKIEMLKKRMREVEMSVKKVEETTKRCPGCQWPIEKNDGCDHMTCIKCRAEFCWACLNDYDKIRRLGNSMHKRSCKFHSDNLA